MPSRLNCHWDSQDDPDPIISEWSVSLHPKERRIWGYAGDSFHALGAALGENEMHICNYFGCLQWVSHLLMWVYIC